MSAKERVQIALATVGTVGMVVSIPFGIAEMPKLFAVSILGGMTLFVVSTMLD